MSQARQAAKPSLLRCRVSATHSNSNPLTLQNIYCKFFEFPVGGEVMRLATDPMGFGHAEKKPTALSASTGITFAKYNGFSQKIREFCGRHAQC